MKSKHRKGDSRRPSITPPGKAISPGRSFLPSRRTSLIVSGVACLAVGALIYQVKLKKSSPPTRSEATVLAPSSRSKTEVALGEIPSTNTMALDLPSSQIDTNDSVQLLNRGTMLLEEGKIDEAIVFYQRAAALKADDEEANFNLGVAHARLANLAARAGRSADAIKLLEAAKRNYIEALRIFPDYPEAHKNLGNLLVEQRRYDEAITHFSAAIRINPDNSSTINSLGKCLGLQGKTREAMAQFREAVRLNTNSVEARFNLASACAKLGEFDEAIREFEQVLKIAPDLELAARQLAEVKARKTAAQK